MLEITILLNKLISDNGLKSYLEIGVGLNSNFDEIICENKTSCDSNLKATFKGDSNEFFKQNEEKFDIVFVDGLHLSEQVILDVENSLKCLNEKGLIVIHDCTPKVEHHQLRERISKCWLGDVWKAIVFFAKRDYNMKLIEIETGIIILKNETQKYKVPHGELTWKWYQKNFIKIFK